MRREAEKCFKIIRETTKPCPGCRSPTEKAGSFIYTYNFSLYVKPGPHDTLCEISCLISVVSFGHPLMHHHAQKFIQRLKSSYVYSHSRIYFPLLHCIEHFEEENFVMFLLISGPPQLLQTHVISVRRLEPGFHIAVTCLRLPAIAFCHLPSPMLPASQAILSCR